MEHGLGAIDLLPQEYFLQLHGPAAADRIVTELLHSKDALV